MPSAPASVADVLRDLAAAMRQLKAPWYVFGAQALVLRGLPRATADLDVTVLAGTLRVSRLVAAMKSHGFGFRAEDQAFIELTRVLPAFHKKTAFPVDVVLGTGGLEQVFAAAATTVRVGALRIPVASPTHLAVMKLVAGRQKDLEDVAALWSTGLVDDVEVERLCREIATAIGEDDALRSLEAVRKRAGPRRSRRARH